VLLQQDALYYRYAGNYPTLWLTQALALAAICGVLRWRGFRLLRARRPDHVAFEIPPPRSKLRFGQFGLLQILVVTTALALLLAAGRGLLLIADSLRPWDAKINLGIASTLVAGALTVAMWSALSVARRRRRITALVTTYALACVAFAIADALAAHRLDFASYWHLLFDYVLVGRFLRSALTRHLGFFAWLGLAVGMTWSTLLLFRSLGYRLSRRAVALVPSAELPPVVRLTPAGELALEAAGPRGEPLLAPAIVEHDAELRMPRLTRREGAILAVVGVLALIWAWDHYRLVKQARDAATKAEKSDRDLRMFLMQQHRAAQATVSASSP
jgi:hypothetical protein